MARPCWAGRLGRCGASARIEGEIALLRKRTHFLEAAEWSWRKRRFLFYKCKCVSCFFVGGYSGVSRFWDEHLRFASKKLASETRKRSKGADWFPGPVLETCAWFTLRLQCSAACQGFCVVSGAKWLISFGVDGCDPESIETRLSAFRSLAVKVVILVPPFTWGCFFGPIPARPIAGSDLVPDIA